MSITTDPERYPLPQPPQPMRGLPTWALVLIVVGVLIVGLIAGGAGGYFARNPEVRRDHQALAKSKAETQAAEDDAQSAWDEVDAEQARLEACAHTVADFRDDIVSLLDAASSAVLGEYYSVSGTLDSLDLTVSPDEDNCLGGKGANS